MAAYEEDKNVNNIKISNQMCRLCTRLDGQMQRLFQTNSSNISNFGVKILYCTSIEVFESEKLPSLICETCIKLLEAFYTFKMRCIDVNDKLMEIIKMDLSEHSNSKITASHVTPSQPPNSSSTNVIQTSSPATRLLDSKHKQRVHLDEPGLPDDLLSLNGSPINIDASPCPTTNKVRRNAMSATHLPTSTGAEKRSSVSSIETIKVEADENDIEVLQRDPLELVSCSYANVTINQLKPETASTLDHGARSPNKNNENTEHESKGLKIFIKSEETVIDNSRSMIGVTRNKNIDRPATCNDCHVTIRFCDRLKCDLCTICFEQRNKNSSTLKCNICSKMFQTKYMLAKHLKYHSKMYKFKCSICDSRLTSSQSLQNHVRLKHSKIKTLKCTICKTGSQYKSYNDLLSHVNKMHSLIDDVGRPTSTDDHTNMTMLQSLDQSEQLNVVKCETNADSHSVSKDLVIEIVNIPNFTCVICNEVFREKRALENHIEIHSPTNIDQKTDFKPKTENNNVKSEDKNLCSYCGKIFTTKKLLYQHVKLTHISIKNHKCQFCDKSYKRSSVLRNHIQAVHEKKKFQCTLCGNLLSSVNSLHSHMKKHETTSKEPTVKCPVCPKLFKYKNNVERHMRSHTGETPYKCSHCPREFTLRWNLIQHERLHRGEKRYKCEKCGKAFTHNVSRKNHMKYHMDDVRIETVANTSRNSMF